MPDAAAAPNVFAKSLGWLFDDLKAAIAASGAEASEAPAMNARSWICIRTGEAESAPDLARTLVQVHDMNPPNPAALQSAGLVAFTHPLQAYIWQCSGFSRPHKILPIGARCGISWAHQLPTRPTIGYFTGETGPGMNHKRSDMFAEAVSLARNSLDFDVLLIGRWLDAVADIGEWHDRAAGLSDYQRIDVLITCSPSPGVPLSVYEACAIGIPIVTTPRWFPTANWPNVFQGGDVFGLASHLVEILKRRDYFFQRRKEHAFAPFSLETWTERQVQWARKLGEADRW
jgi:hypothetical protein